MTEEKSEWDNFVGEYAGRTSKKVGSGEKEALKYVLLFNIHDSKFPKKVHVFQNTLDTLCEKNDTEMQELNFYKVGIVKNKYTSDGEERYTWNLGSIQESTKEEYEKKEVKPITAAEATNNSPKEVDTVLLEKLYTKLVKDDNVNIMRLVADYFVNKDQITVVHINTFLKDKLMKKKQEDKGEEKSIEEVLDAPTGGDKEDLEPIIED